MVDKKTDDIRAGWQRTRDFLTRLITSSILENAERRGVTRAPIPDQKKPH